MQPCATQIPRYDGKLPRIGLHATDRSIKLGDKSTAKVHPTGIIPVFGFENVDTRRRTE